MLVTIADFIGEINIPNTNKDYVAENLQLFIDKYEPLYLKQLLGDDLYALFIAGLPTGTVTTVPAGFEVYGVGTKFTTMFVVGNAITVAGETHTIDEIIDDLHLTTITAWVGSNIHATYYGDIKWVNLLAYVTQATANYIYWYFIKSANTYNSGIGVVKPTTENSVVVSPIDTMVRSWNEMVELSYKTVEFIQTNNADYGNYYNQNIFHLYYYGYCRYTLPEIFYKQNVFGI